MRAKVRVGAVIPAGDGADGKTEVLHLHGVAKNGTYPPDGHDEDNSFARWSPSVMFQMHIANPALVGSFEVGDTFYVDFVPASKG
ncbi:hypothetical protein IB276_10780 [Ensifer sp. ENS04]|nr:hypothetical protein [Ensifer sp. ENS04]